MKETEENKSPLKASGHSTQFSVTFLLTYIKSAKTSVPESALPQSILLTLPFDRPCYPHCWVVII